MILIPAGFGSKIEKSASHILTAIEFRKRVKILNHQQEISNKFHYAAKLSYCLHHLIMTSFTINGFTVYNSWLRIRMDFDPDPDREKKRDPDPT